MNLRKSDEAMASSASIVATAMNIALIAGICRSSHHTSSVTGNIALVAGICWSSHHTSSILQVI